MNRNTRSQLFDKDSTCQFFDLQVMKLFSSYTAFYCILRFRMAKAESHSISNCYSIRNV